jgi:hypothetical protein
MTIRDTGSDFASDIKKKRDDPILRGRFQEWFSGRLA